eukprot:4267396-Amphidinium_carterae.1
MDIEVHSCIHEHSCRSDYFCGYSVLAGSHSLSVHSALRKHVASEHFSNYANKYFEYLVIAKLGYSDRCSGELAVVKYISEHWRADHRWRIVIECLSGVAPQFGENGLSFHMNSDCQHNKDNMPKQRKSQTYVDFPKWPANKSKHNCWMEMRMKAFDQQAVQPLLGHPAGTIAPL